MIVTGGAMALHDLDWIRAHLPDDGSGSVADVSSGRCCIGLWGPRARDVLSQVCEDDVSNAGFPYMTAKRIAIGDVPALALRVSYVGELGWEIYAPTEQGARAVGHPVGSRARRSASLRPAAAPSTPCGWKRGTGCGVPTSTRSTTLTRRASGFAVRMQKGDFIGRSGLQETATGTGPAARRLCCVTLDAPDAVVMGKEPIMDGEPRSRLRDQRQLRPLDRTSALPTATCRRAHAEVWHAGRHPVLRRTNCRHRCRSEPLYDPAGRKDEEVTPWRKRFADQSG